MTEPSEATAAAEPRAPGGPADTPPAATGPRSVTTRATLAGVAVSALLILAIVLGSRMLRNFDSALLPYAVATVFLAFGVAYRYTVWISAPVPDASSNRAGAASSRTRTSAGPPPPCRR